MINTLQYNRDDFSYYDLAIIKTGGAEKSILFVYFFTRKSSAVFVRFEYKTAIIAQHGLYVPIKKCRTYQNIL